MRRLAPMLLVLPLLSCVETPQEHITAALDGQRWEMPCLDDGPDDAHCVAPGEVTHDVTLDAITGATTTGFAVTARVRGVVEHKIIEDAAYIEDTWTVGGTPADDEDSLFSLVVSDPGSIHHLNAGSPGGDRTWPVDLEITFDVAPNATVTLRADDGGDDLQLCNQDDNGDPLVIDDVPPAPDPFDGQFLQLDVIEVIEQ